jgi:hypothetical protein
VREQCFYNSVPDPDTVSARNVYAYIAMGVRSFVCHNAIDIIDEGLSTSLEIALGARRCQLIVLR